MKSLRAFALLIALLVAQTNVTRGDSGPAPEQFFARAGQLRVDLRWKAQSSARYEIQRAATPNGPFEPLPNEFPTLPLYSDFVGQAGGNFYYRVRRAAQTAGEASAWSEVRHAAPQPLNVQTLPDEVEGAGFRYFYDYGHPVSGLAREGLKRDPNLCATGATGMGLCNLVVGVERSFVPRQDGIQHALKILRFLATKADRFHGAFPHWLNGTTGKTIPFSQFDDGADLVETAFLMQGVLLLREYFAANTPDENELRHLCNALWRDVEWDWFTAEENGRLFLYWHWSPRFDRKMKLRITGFNECQIVYILALASPTHAIAPKLYWQGWQAPGYAKPRIEFGIPLQLGHGEMPLFLTQYSYLGFDPRRISYAGKTYFEHFRDLSRAQVAYADSRRGDFKGYGPLWGLTSSYGPDGYSAFAPGPHDNGTLAPTAALSAMPYVPEESRVFLTELYVNHGKTMWGPFGFYDAFNLSQNWVARDYLGIDVGPIAPMLENARSELCWKTFMRAPEIILALERLSAPQSIGINN